MAFGSMYRCGKNLCYLCEVNDEEFLPPNFVHFSAARQRKHVFSALALTKRSCGTYGPDLHSKMTLPGSRDSSLCQTPLGISTP